jgi:hypothetical protein
VALRGQETAAFWAWDRYLPSFQTGASYPAIRRARRVHDRHGYHTIKGQ